MTRFDDYHRTVVGYHGTGLTAALRIVNRISEFAPSERDFDWLGKGIYFWEYAPRQALHWAQLRQERYAKKAKKTAEDKRRATEPLAVVGCMIRLGFCLDLTEPDNIQFVQDTFVKYKGVAEQAGVQLPSNDRHYRRLDCAVFEHVYGVIAQERPTRAIDTARGVYVPTDRTKRVWDGSWIARDTHTQICVRNPSSILGAWLYHPTDLKVNDVCQALQDAADGD